jgi:hypothetical protein
MKPRILVSPDDLPKYGFPNYSNRHRKRLEDADVLPRRVPITYHRHGYVEGRGDREGAGVGGQGHREARRSVGGGGMKKSAPKSAQDDDVHAFDAPHSERKRGGRRSRDKGNRTERALVRVPLSGAAGGRFTGDLTVPVLGIDQRCEVKCRAAGFAQLYGWIDNRDLLIVKRDRAEPLAGC